MTWRSIKIREEEKEKLDEIKVKERKENGQNPSYSDLIGEMLEETGFKEVERKERKKEKGRDFMELF